MKPFNFPLESIRVLRKQRERAAARLAVSRDTPLTFRSSRYAEFLDTPAARAACIGFSPAAR